MWDSIEALRALSHALMWAAVVSGTLAAATTGLRYYVDRRVANLSAAAFAAAEQAREGERQVREASLKQELAQAQEKVGTLETKARPRTLTTEQSRILAARLRECPVKAAAFTAPLGDPEAFAFAEQLASLFKTAGWDSVGVNQSVFTSPPLGLALRVPSKSNVHPCAAFVQQAFAGIGLQAPAQVVAGIPVNRLDIVVGHKE